VDERDASLASLRAENDALRRALRLLSEVANLVRAAEDPDATAYAILTGVTAGVGLGMNCAMIFEPDPHDPDVLVGRAAVGPHDRAEADRVWRAIEAEQPSLETLYEAGVAGTAETRRAIEVTCSVGVAATPPEPADAVTLLRAADDALLRAKRRGRDRVERSDEMDAFVLRDE
jgi:GGDEF domain-containing protein